MEIYQRLIGELDANGQHLSEQISEIDLSDPEDARVLMPEQGTDILAHFGADHFLERYQRYKAHIAEWRQQYPKLAEVDLRYEQQVVLQMTGGRECAPAKLNASERDSTPRLESPKPEPGEPEVKVETPQVCAAEARRRPAKRCKGAQPDQILKRRQKPGRRNIPIRSTRVKEANAEAARCNTSPASERTMSEKQETI